MIIRQPLWSAGLVAVVALFIGLAAAAESKIAVVDTQLILSQANAAKTAAEAIKKATETAQNKVNAIEARLAKQQEELRGKKGVLSADKFAEEEEKFRKAVRDFRTEAQSIQAALEQDSRNRRNRVIEAVRVEIEAMAKEKGYDIAIAKNLVLYAGAQDDLTQDVLKRVNAKVK